MIAGRGDDTQTTTNRTAPLSDLGQSYQSLLQGLIMQNLQTSGYDIKPNTKTTYKDQAAADQLQQQIAKLSDSTGGRGNMQQQILQAKLDAMPKSDVTTYNVTKIPDPRVQAAIDQYGAGSPQANAVTQQIQQEKVNQASALSTVNQDYLKNLTKLVSGDLSYTDQQKKQVDAYFAPIKSIIMDTGTKLMSQVGDNSAALGMKLQDISHQIDLTGFNVGDTLKAASIQVDKNQGDLLSVLQKVNSSTEANYKFQQDLMFQQVDKQAAQQNALLGLPPNSQLEQYQRAKMRVDASTQLALQLNQQEATGALQIAGQTAADKKQIAFSYVTLAESQGAKKENVASEAYNLATQTFGKQEAIQGAQQNALINLQQGEQNQLLSTAYGNLPQLIAAGQGGIGFQQNQAAQLQQMQLAGMGPTTGQLGFQNQLQLANNTTTQTTSPGFMSTLGSALGMAGGVAGAALTGGASLGVGAGANALGNAFASSPNQYSLGPTNANIAQSFNATSAPTNYNPVSPFSLNKSNYQFP